MPTGRQDRPPVPAVTRWRRRMVRRVLDLLLPGRARRRAEAERARRAAKAAERAAAVAARAEERRAEARAKAAGQRAAAEARARAAAEAKARAAAAPRPADEVRADDGAVDPAVRPILCRHAGRMANRLVQYLFCRTVAERIPGAAVYGADIPELGFRTAAWTEAGTRGLIPFIGQNCFDPDEMAHFVLVHGARGILFQGHALRASYFDRTFCRGVYEAIARPVVEGYGPGHLVFHVRAGDILDPGAHPLYRPLPIGYMEHLVRTTGLAPVLIGEIHRPSRYVDELRRRFADAVIPPPGTPAEDFETIRRSRHIALSISTFAWAAGFLSEAERIHYPVAGQLDPAVARGSNLMPADDPAYVFHPLPDRRWWASEEDYADAFATHWPP